MSNELLGLWEQTKPSVMVVIHDPEEAIALADQVVVMTAGPGTVKAVYEIDLPRPRGAVQEIRFQPRFLEVHHQSWGALTEAGPASPDPALGGPPRDARDCDRRLAAVHQREDRQSVLLGPAQRDCQAAQ